MNRQPPRLATWLLKRLALGPRRESLIGDLTERYQLKRSAAWYWRQVLTATLVGAGRDIRYHKLVAVRGLITGWLALWLFLRYVPYPVSYFDDWLFVTGFADVRRWWPDHYFLSSLLVLIGGLCAGWSVVRWHRTSMALLFAASVSLYHVLWFFFVAVPFIRAAAWLPPYGTFIIQIALLILLLPLAIVLGGLSAPDRERDGPPAPDVLRWVT